MYNLIEPNWKDEILSDAEKYRIRKNNEIIEDNISIEQITPTIQEPTPLNKRNLETPIGEIRFFSNKRDDDKYLLCDGSRILKEDYPELVYCLPEKYVYEANQIASGYGYITQIIYISEKNIYFLVRRGISDEVGFTIWSSNDGDNWTLRYTSATSYYSNPPSITYYPQFNIFVGKTNKIILTSTDGISWTIAKSETSSSDYYYSNITYSPRLGKAFFVRYKTSSTYYSYVFSTSNFINFTQISSKSGSTTEVFRGPIIENGNDFICSGIGSLSTQNYTNAIWKSSDNGVTWVRLSPFDGVSCGEPLFSTGSCVKFGQYWYSCWGTASSSNYKIVRTTDFTTTTILYSGLSSAGIIGIVNGFLYVHTNGNLIRIDELGKRTTLSKATNLRYFKDRKEYVKIENNQLYSSKDLMNWECYDVIGTSLKLSSIFYNGNRIYAINSDSYTTTYFLYDEHEINLPQIDLNYAYIKALDESE